VVIETDAATLRLENSELVCTFREEVGSAEEAEAILEPILVRGDVSADSRNIVGNCGSNRSRDATEPNSKEGCILPLCGRRQQHSLWRPERLESSGTTGRHERVMADAFERSFLLYSDGAPMRRPRARWRMRVGHQK
jgi:hypothetical protein